MSTQQSQPEQPAPTERPDAGELARKAEVLAEQIADHLAKLRREGKA